MELIERIFTDFSEIHGDRAFGDDEAVASGMARFGADEVMVIGNRKGGRPRSACAATSACRTLRVIASPRHEAC